MNDKLTVGELKRRIALLDDAMPVFIYHDGFQDVIAARTAQVVIDHSRERDILVIDTRP